MSPDAVKPEKEKLSKTLPATVEKIIPAIGNVEPEKAQIAIDGADELYKEVRVENVLTDKNGNAVALKPGAEVQVEIQADKGDTKPVKSSSSSD